MPSHPTTGVYIKNATGITLRNVAIEWGRNHPAYFGEAIELINVRDICIDRFTGSSAHTEV